MQGTEVVYICGADYWRYLFLSMRTLFATGSQFDRVTIYIVGDELPNWKFDDPRIKLELVPDIGDGYWYTNKAHICKSEYSRTIFLDTDVMVLSPLEHTYAGVDADIIARIAPGTYKSVWNQTNWENLLEHVGGARDIPYFSCGFVVYQNDVHKRLESEWPAMTKSIINGELPTKVTRFAEQQALSLLIGKLGLSYHMMKDNHHVYAMNGETHEDAVVYHLGTPNFYHFYFPVERELGLADLQLPVTRPGFLKVHEFQTKVKKRLDKVLYGHRDLVVQKKSWRKIFG